MAMAKLDLVSMCVTSSTLTGLEQKTYLSVNLGNGDGTFQYGKTFQSRPPGRGRDCRSRFQWRWPD
jgi:hypothetical protein